MGGYTDVEFLVLVGLIIFVTVVCGMLSIRD